MIADREQWLAETLVGLADTLVTDFDVVDLLSTLAERITEVISATDVGFVLADPLGRLHVMAASTERVRLLDLFEVQSSEGPCLDCYTHGRGIVNVDLEQAGPTWPHFTPMAREAGYRTVHAFPMSLRDHVIGAVNIFHATPVAVAEHDLHLVQALADMATIALLQERAVRRATEVAEQLDHALNSRIVIEQAKGAISERAQVDVDLAFGWLRGYARSHNRRLAEVAAEIVSRLLDVEELRGVRAEPNEPG